ncbi:MAG: hypothetical protein A2Y33_11770 [Spirochaetes bacterium GWF1_51_8]|nr:MAG: hypothetical protein A2Y33_11770 [Spirochaetes bacterium GWF1_51_8]
MKIQFKWIGGATWVMDAGGLKIACDPVLCAKGTIQDYRYFKSERLDSPVYTKDDFKGIDFWLITHIHEDHIDMRGMAAMGDSAIYSPVVLPRKKGAKVLRAGETDRFELAGKGVVTVTAVPAVHSVNPLLGGLIGNGNGYIVEYAGGGELFTFYVSGDALIHRGMFRALRDKKIDLAVLNTGNAVLGEGLLSKLAGRITMNSKDVARFDRLFHPAAIIPVHWGTFSHYRENLNDAGIVLPQSVKLMAPGDTVEIF